MAQFITRTEFAYVFHYYVAKLSCQTEIRPHHAGMSSSVWIPFADTVADVVVLYLDPSVARDPLDLREIQALAMS